MIAFSVESALEACARLGYPAVLKPVTGSWGRLLAKVNGPEQARLILEQKKELGSIHHAIFYVQEYHREARIAIFAPSSSAIASWRPRTGRRTTGSRTPPGAAQSISCPVTPEIEEMALRACRAVGARWAGVDLIETDRGSGLHRGQSGGEFHGLMTTTDVDIADEIVREAIGRGDALHELAAGGGRGDRGAAEFALTGSRRASLQLKQCVDEDR